MLRLKWSDGKNKSFQEEEEKKPSSKQANLKRLHCAYITDGNILRHVKYHQTVVSFMLAFISWLRWKGRTKACFATQTHTHRETMYYGVHKPDTGNQQTYRNVYEYVKCECVFVYLLVGWKGAHVRIQANKTSPSTYMDRIDVLLCLHTTRNAGCLSGAVFVRCMKVLINKILGSRRHKVHRGMCECGCACDYVYVHSNIFMVAVVLVMHVLHCVIYLVMSHKQGSGGSEMVGMDQMSFKRTDNGR